MRRLSGSWVASGPAHARPNLRGSRGCLQAECVSNLMRCRKVSACVAERESFRCVFIWANGLFRQAFNQRRDVCSGVLSGSEVSVGCLWSTRERGKCWLFYILLSFYRLKYRGKWYFAYSVSHECFLFSKRENGFGCFQRNCGQLHE